MRLATQQSINLHQCLQGFILLNLAQCVFMGYMGSWTLSSISIIMNSWLYIHMHYITLVMSRHVKVTGQLGYRKICFKCHCCTIL